MFAWIKGALTIIPTAWKVINFVGVIRDIGNLVHESIEFIQRLKQAFEKMGDEGKALLKELDDVTEKAADICKRLPGMKKSEIKLRDLIPTKDE